MTDRPILFGTPMVRALLVGKKTQTRRLAWRLPPLTCPAGCTLLPGKPTIWQKVRPGDRLWVREKHWAVERANQGIGIPHLIYDDEWLGAFPNERAPLRPCGLEFGAHASIHMFRWASRLALIVTEARIERLQKISHDEAVAEGVGIFPHSMSAQKRFRELWNSIHGSRSWDDNPAVVAVTFEVVQANIDEIGKAA